MIYLSLVPDEVVVARISSLAALEGTFENFSLRCVLVDMSLPIRFRLHSVT